MVHNTIAAHVVCALRRQRPARVLRHVDPVDRLINVVDPNVFVGHVEGQLPRLQGCPPPPHGLHVLLRHRPPSIPRRTPRPLGAGRRGIGYLALAVSTPVGGELGSGEPVEPDDHDLGVGDWPPPGVGSCTQRLTSPPPAGTWAPPFIDSVDLQLVASRDHPAVGGAADEAAPVSQLADRLFDRSPARPWPEEMFAVAVTAQLPAGSVLLTTVVKLVGNAAHPEQLAKVAVVGFGED